MGIDAVVAAPCSLIVSVEPLDNEASSAVGAADREEQSLASGTSEDLMSLVAEGNRGALVVLFRRHGGSVRSVGLRILRDEGEADDLLQELFLFLFHKASIFEPAKSSAKSWIIQMAYHRAIERRRYLKHRQFYGAESLDPDRHQVSRGDDENASVQRIDGAAFLRRYQSVLSVEQRQTLELHFFGGYELREIAEMTNQTLSNVRAYYYRALKRIRAELKSQGTSAQ